ncbi:MAG: TetR/AcrR family transcriptional regulator [Marmoricola sp.]
MPAPGATPADARSRLLDGLAAALAERPYAEVTVAEVVRRARTSRRTFYEHFADKQDCLVALLRDSHERTVAAIAAAVDPAQPWPVQIRQAIEAWLRATVAEPHVTLSWIRVVPSLGEGAAELMRDTMSSFAELIHRLSDTPALAAAGVRPPVPQATTMLLGGLRELIATTVEEGGDVLDVVEVASDVAARILGPADPVAHG